MLAVDVLVLAFLGYYFDQVLPKQYGVARPWNFLCVSEKSKKKQKKSHDSGPRD